MRKILLIFLFLCLTSNIQYLFSANLLAGAAKLKTTPLVETFVDQNHNGQYDPGEPFDDLNHNGKWDPVWLAGYRGDRWAKGVHDDLWVRALVLTEDRTAVLFISLDLVGYLFDEVDRVKEEIHKQFGIESSHVLIASTHDHSGPDAIGLWGPGGKSGKDADYLKLLRERTLLCVKQAIANQKPARLAFAKIHYGDPIEDSRPPKVIDDLLLSMRAVDEQGQTIATLVNYAMHAEVLNESNRMITADYPGVLRDALEDKYGGTALFFAADLGGMQSPFVFFHSFWSCKNIGRAIAWKVIESQRVPSFPEIGAISVESKKILMPVDNPRFQMAIKNGLFGETSKFTKQEGGKIFLPSELSVVRIGPAIFIAIPGEAFPELGNIIKEKIKSDFPFLIGLCNNEIGYIMPKEEWRDGGYEESMSLGPETGGQLVTAIEELIEK